jgi:tetratricopeptide (TPR) repeat protein
MNASQIHATYKSILHFISSLQLINAFEKTELLVRELQLGQYADRLEDLQQNYKYLIQYYVDGVDDPQRILIYNKLKAKLFVLCCELQEELLFRNSSGFEYTQKRYFPHNRRFESVKELFQALQYFHSQSSILSQSEQNHDIELNRLRSNYETLLSELFNRFWLTTTINTDEKSIFLKILSEDYPGMPEKNLIVSSLMLNLWRMFDESKLLMLLDACLSTDLRVKQRALVGLCFILARYNQFIPNFPVIRNRLVLLADDHHVVENFRNIIIQMIGTAETDKISKKMREEILPEMMKISPMLKDKMDVDSIINPDEWGEINPEWQDMLDKSGISDKLQELSELQLEGADVYMSTFSMLKSFPFFNDISHWFLPFDTGYSSVNELFINEEKTFLSSFVNSMVMCNSDKYSFCLSLMQMPEKQRNMMKHTMGAEAEQLDEMNKEEAILAPNLLAKNISKQYIQDLFRFFKLFPQHNDFSDMFRYSLLMHDTFLFDILSADDTFKATIAEYYFSKNHFKEALDMFEEMQNDTAPVAALYQKIGYAYQQTSQLENALEAYHKADIIQPDDIWTIRKMAMCYRLSGNFEKALEYYQYVDFLKPNQTTVLMQIGYCYQELKKFKEALAIFYKLDALETDNVKVSKAIVWCNFVSGNIEKAEYQSNKLIEAEPNTQNFLNAGHIAFCKHDLKNALKNYKSSIEMSDNNWNVFFDSFNKDKNQLIANGVDANEIPLLLDALRSDKDSINQSFTA